MAKALHDYAGNVNLRCLPYDSRAPVLPTAVSRRAAVYLRRLGWRRHPRLDWCCLGCTAPATSTPTR
jgi:hypothetical protein